MAPVNGTEAAKNCTDPGKRFFPRHLTWPQDGMDVDSHNQS